MARIAIKLSFVTLMLACLCPLFGDAPVKFEKVAAIEDLVSEAKAKTELLQASVATSETFKEAIEDKQIAKDGGVLACLAQAITEHPKKADVKVSGPSLRDAAIQLRDSKTFDVAKQAMATVNQVWQGEKLEGAEADFEWKSLINLHRLMEEVNSRNSKLRRVARNSKEPIKDSLHATTIAVLALAAHADTHEVKEEASIPKWQKLALEFQNSMTAVATAMKDGDHDKAYSTWRDTQTKSCKACHEAFRKE